MKTRNSTHYPLSATHFDLESETETILELKRGIVENFLEIGRRLIKVKENIPHGEFGRWLRERVGITWNMANRLMRVARELPNCEPVHNLGIKKAYELLKLPPGKREEFLREPQVIGVDSEGRVLRKPATSMSHREIKLAVEYLRSNALRTLGGGNGGDGTQFDVGIQGEAMDMLRGVLERVSSHSFGPVSPSVGNEFLRLLRLIEERLKSVGMNNVILSDSEGSESSVLPQPPRCSVCGRKLTDVESISRGMGPECLRHLRGNM